MLIISTNAEQKLHEYLESIKAHTNLSRRAILIRNFSGLYEGEDTQIATMLMNYLEDTLQETDARVFRCHDNDLILIGKGITASHYQAMNVYLVDNYFVDGSCTTFYEQSRNWFQFTNMCKEKLEGYFKHVEHHKRDSVVGERQRKRDAALNQELPKDLINSLSKRRLEREHLEVMVVEDDPFSRQLVTSALRSAGYIVTPTENGHQFIGEYPVKAPDIIFLDIDLPDVSGHEILQKILSIDPNAYVVMLSANHDESNVMGAIKKGAKGFVVKPFTKGKLLSYIEKAPTYQPAA